MLFCAGLHIFAQVIWCVCTQTLRPARVVISSAVGWSYEPCGLLWFCKVAKPQLDALGFLRTCVKESVAVAMLLSAYCRGTHVERFCHATAAAVVC